MRPRPAHKRAGGDLEKSDRRLIVASLTRALAGRGKPPESVKLEPGPHLHSGSFPSETAVCRFSDGEVLEVFCKCSKGWVAPSHRHRGGVAYEAEVYQRLVGGFAGSSADFLGAFESPPHDLACLFLELLPDALRVSKTTVENMARAAAWIGHFHATWQRSEGGTEASFLTRYDLSYYSQWPRRVLELTGPLRGEHPWLGEVCRAFLHELAPRLVAAQRTVIHGEYYPKNILVQSDVIYPVDWESAALGCGEIDLASLTEGWEEGDTARCADAYRRARWPGGAPVDHEETLEAARVYWLLRWLGNGSYFATGKQGLRRLGELAGLAHRLDLVPRRRLEL